MTKLAIDVDSLSKCYRLGVHTKRHEHFAGALWSTLTTPFTAFNRLRKLTSFEDNESGDDVLWAVKDASFHVNDGEVLGIIGKNGAGKSTLLKLLSHITRPSSGCISIHGRVASLLEVGTGFHPDLTGRENVYLNGTILGMTKAEISSKFHEIVDFAEVERFIDTPVKRYSSGMLVRLAFAVAAFLEPEILIVDEVLAVGDVAFQKKCLGKMGDVAKNQGRTVLFVSHNMGAVRTLCSRALLLHKGTIIESGDTEKVINAYLSGGVIPQESTIEMPRKPEDTAYATAIHVSSSDGEAKTQFRIQEEIHATIEFELEKKLEHVIVGFGLNNAEGLPIITYWSEEQNLDKGRYKVLFPVQLDLAAGDYTFTVGISTNERPVYFQQDVGLISVMEVAIDKQPMRTSGTGVLVSFNRPKVKVL